MVEREERDRTGEPVDGPGRREPGEDEADRPTHQEAHPDDTNERADSRARVEEPGSGEESPRADS